ncbi:MAG: polysaccharide biosynthesis/export family protein [Rikenellaceae bacterium]|jgi:polysaccharide export outer membrane protein|nr:polysaccharide biosynthesis/export family protein [Rikenellaceae bacterium]
MKRLVILLPVFLLFVGCGSLEKVTYLNDVTGDEVYTLPSDYEITIQPADFLTIVVSAQNATESELTLSLNGPTMDLGMRGATIRSEIYNYNYPYGYDSDRRGYLVDKNGDINFPLLGRIHVQGMTRDSLITYLENRIRTEGYLSTPIVTAKTINLKIAVLGEVKLPGQFPISTERITVLDALGLAGDMTIYGNRSNVKVIRENNGVRTISELNLNSKDIFNSPYFYLRQNDVVYVEPNKRKAEQGSVSPLWSLGVSTGGLLVSLATLILVTVGGY